MTSTLRSLPHFRMSASHPVSIPQPSKLVVSFEHCFFKPLCLCRTFPFDWKIFPLFSGHSKFNDTVTLFLTVTFIHWVDNTLTGLCVVLYHSSDHTMFAKLFSRILLSFYIETRRPNLTEMNAPGTSLLFLSLPFLLLFSPFRRCTTPLDWTPWVLAEFSYRPRCCNRSPVLFPPTCTLNQSRTFSFQSWITPRRNVGHPAFFYCLHTLPTSVIHTRNLNMRVRFLVCIYIR